MTKKGRSRGLGGICLKAVGQVMIDGEEYEFQAIGDIQFLKNIAKVILDLQLAEG